MPILITNTTIICGSRTRPLENQSVWIENGRIKAIERSGNLENADENAAIIDGRGRFIIPGLMNANVHLFSGVNLESLSRYFGRYDELIEEAAQVSLRGGLTTVFDTWGPRRSLIAVRDRIADGGAIGSRIFCAGNIIGFDGPFSADFDFLAKASSAATPAFAKKINAMWVENVGRHLMWRSTEQVAEEVRAYIGRGIDFVKYASNEHVPGGFLAFSEQTQLAIVEEAHRAGRTAQAHTMSVEGLRMAIEAGCDLIQHANITGPEPIPDSTLKMMAARGTGAVVFPYTKRAWEWMSTNEGNGDRRTYRQAMDVNARRLVDSGATLLLGNDGVVIGPEMMAQIIGAWKDLPEEDFLHPLDTGHFAWFRAMEEKGCRPIDMLKAATCNIAKAYGKDKDLGTLEVGKIADILVLNKDPLASAENFNSIEVIIKDGVRVDRDRLPVRPILEKPADPPEDEESSYVPYFNTGGGFPICPTCTRGGM